MHPNFEADIKLNQINTQEENSDLAQILRIFLGNSGLIGIVTVIGTIISAIYLFSMPDQYAANAKVLVEKINSKWETYDAMSLPALQQADEDYYGTQIDILTGRKVSAAVKSELQDMPDRYRVDARRIRNTRIILISVLGTNPEWAAKIANKYAEIFVRESLKQNDYMSEQILKLMPKENEEFSAESATEKDAFNKKEYLGSLPTLTNDPILQKLRADKFALEAQLSELSDRYKPQHPLIREANQKLDYINQQINDKTQKIVSNLTASLKGKVNVTNIKVLEEASAPGRPSGPNRPLGILFGAGISFILSALLAFTMEHVNQKITVEEDINNFLGVPFLGYIPLVNELLKSKNKKDKTGHSMPGILTAEQALAKNSMLMDAVANVRTHILFSVPNEKSTRIMFTSSVPDEGKSTVVALLAASFLSLGMKVLAIDADLRRSFLHRYFNVTHDIGLTNYLVGSATLDEIIFSVPNSNLKIITGGALVPNPSELLSSQRFKEFLELASENFDKIIIDSPPALYIPDGLIIAKFVHACVLVCGANMVDRKAAKAIKDKFDVAGGHGKLVGAIINRVNYKKEGYRYRYYKSYKNYYDEKNKPQAASL